MFIVGMDARAKTSNVKPDWGSKQGSSYYMSHCKNVNPFLIVNLVFCVTQVA